MVIDELDAGFVHFVENFVIQALFFSSISSPLVFIVEVELLCLYIFLTAEWSISRVEYIIEHRVSKVLFQPVCDIV